MTELFDVKVVAKQVGVTTQTINHWYKYKRENPDEQLAKLLPDYQQKNCTAPRLWTTEGIIALRYFKEVRPLGTNGLMKSVTKRYYKKKEN